MSEAESPNKSTLVNDIAKIVEIDAIVSNLFHVVHVDNLGFIASEQEKVIVVMTELEQLFSGGGLALHEVSVGTGKQEVLGTNLDCSRQATLLTSRRFHRLYKSISALLRRKRTTGIVSEVII